MDEQKPVSHQKLVQFLETLASDFEGLALKYDSPYFHGAADAYRNAARGVSRYVSGTEEPPLTTDE